MVIIMWLMGYQVADQSRQTVVMFLVSRINPLPAIRQNQYEDILHRNGLFWGLNGYKLLDTSAARNPGSHAV